MAIRARLTAPRETREEWLWHEVESTSLPASMLFGADRRMEAESYLAEGFNTRLQIEAKRQGWERLSDLVDTWQPNRLKGTLVHPDHGMPFLSATQVFDLRPAPRKWLSKGHVKDLDSLLVKPGMILVTRSGTVGRATLARESIVENIISDDLLRIAPKNAQDWGWVYAFLRSNLAVKMMQSAQYGHVIKHLEPSHMNSIPLPVISLEIKQNFSDRVAMLLSLRNGAERLTRESETLLSKYLTPDGPSSGEHTFSQIGTSELFSDRRRFEAAFHSPRVRELLAAIGVNSRRIERVGDLVSRVWWMTRFSRNFGDGGVMYRSADDLFAISQVTQKQVYLEPIPNPQEFFVKSGWLLMACSGQIYGLNGSVTLATEFDEGFFFSHDLIRIAPKLDSIRSGYLFAYLGHPEIGQLLVKRNAYGSSVPHIDPGDVERIPVARLSEAQEDEIADLAEEASRRRAEADHVEREIAAEADGIITSFLS
jgi:hypothetical protein